MDSFKLIAPPPLPFIKGEDLYFLGARLQLPLSTKRGPRRALKAVTSDICTTKELYFVAHKQ